MEDKVLPCVLVVKHEVDMTLEHILTWVVIVDPTNCFTLLVKEVVSLEKTW